MTQAATVDFFVMSSMTSRNRMVHLQMVAPIPVPRQSVRVGQITSRLSLSGSEGKGFVGRLWYQ
jgi:hypothetical protein